MNATAMQASAPTRGGRRCPSSGAAKAGLRLRRRASALGIALPTPYGRASQLAVETTPRGPVPATSNALPEPTCIG